MNNIIALIMGASAYLQAGIATPEILAPLELGHRLAMDSGLPESKSATLVRHIYDHSWNKEPDFLRYTYAIIYHESRFLPRSLSDKGAQGLMQLTDPAIIEARRQCGLPEPEDITVPRTNVKYGTCYLSYLRSTLSNWTEVLIVYNGGYRALRQYHTGHRLNSETASYVVRVMETVRDE